jgi:hypothetical protein
LREDCGMSYANYRKGLKGRHLKAMGGAHRNRESSVVNRENSLENLA